MQHAVHGIRMCLVASLLALAAPLASAGTITLKAAARQRTGSAMIVLGDIAALEGEEAQRLADVPIATFRGPQPMEITVAEVRRALDAAMANWARIDLSGGRVIVRPARDAGAAPPAAMTAIALDGAPAVAPEVAASDAFTLDAACGRRTVRGMIADLLIVSLNAAPSDVRLRGGTRALPLLDASTTSTRFEVQPLGALSGDRIAFAVRSWNGAATEDHGQVTLNVERRATVARAARDLPRGSVITPAEIEPADLWLGASEAALVATPDEALHCAVARSMNAGEVIRRRDLAHDLLVKRGDIVTVRCLVGGVAISLAAEARADGARGEVIEFRKRGERESFHATVTARNQAAIDLSRR